MKHTIFRKLFTFWELYLDIFIHGIMRRIN